MTFPANHLRRAAFLFTLAAALPAQQHPTPETAAWWAQTTALSNDAMEGRDTGTEAYERAARYVAAQFNAAGLKPAGDDGTFFQRVPMQQVDLLDDRSAVDLLPTRVSLRFTTDVTTIPRADVDLPAAPLVFLGYGIPPAGMDLQGRIGIFFNNIPVGLSPAERESYPARRLRALTEAGVAAIFSVDNPAATEPFHWPAAYARSVTLAGPPTSPTKTPPVLRINPAALASLLGTRAADANRFLAEGGTGAPLPTFTPGVTARIHLKTATKPIASPNILGLLPGSDPTLAPEYVALSAHLDGYGFGTPVLGDRLYNGTLDDAAYVALLLEMARSLHKKPPARSLLFCVFTGEEKGLLGSAWFTAHPPVPLRNIVADPNLDQLRPIFPLKILTMEGLADSTLGVTARTLAAGLDIELRPDREPERNLFRRADNYNFVRAGIPIASFLFGYNPGSPEEAVYRDWYARRYHKPQDDLATPIDWAAAATFNRFYQQLAVTVANAPAPPTWLPGSAYAPKP